MQKSKRITTFILAFALTLSLVTPAFASNPAQDSAAKTLCTLGVFNGTGTDAAGNPNFDLDRTPTRAEAAVMLIRLLGKETYAKEMKLWTPFTDTATYSWALPHVGYAYSYGLAQGSGTTFDGNSPTTAAQYLTFVLRALGYNSSSDFQWDKSIAFADSIGLTSGEYSNGQSFTRGGVALISLRALSLSKKGTNTTLLQQLVNDGAIAENKVIATGLKNALIDPAAPMTTSDLAHFLVSNFPIKSYIDKYSEDIFPTNLKQPKYASDIITLLNAGVFKGNSSSARFFYDMGISNAEFASILYSFFVESGCGVESIVPRLNESTQWYDNAMTFMMSIGVFTKGTDPTGKATMQLLTSETVKKFQSIPGWENAGTVSAMIESVEPKYIELDGKVCNTRSWDYFRVQKINVNGIDSLYIEAPTTFVSNTEWSGISSPTLSNLLTYAKGDYRIVATDNPFLDGQLADVGSKGLIKTSKKEEYISATRKKIFTTVSNDSKSLTSTDFPTGGISDVKGIQCVNGYLKVSDVLVYFGIKKTVTIEKKDDLEVICFR